MTAAATPRAHARPRRSTPTSPSRPRSAHRRRQGRLLVAHRPDVVPAGPPHRDGRDHRDLGGPPTRGARRPVRRARRRDRGLPRGRASSARSSADARTAFAYGVMTGAAPRRRALSRRRHVRDRRDAEPDPLHGLPPAGRGLAARVVPDRPQDGPLGLAPAVRAPVRAGRPAHARGRRRRPASRSSSTRCRSSTSPRSGCSRIATSIFSALNERELRQRRADLQALVEVGARLDAVADAIQQADIVLGALVVRFGFERGRAARRVRRPGRRPRHASARPTPPTTSSDPDWIVRRAWERREILPVKQLDPSATRSSPRSCRTRATSSSPR